MEGLKTDRKEYLRKYLPSAEDKKKKKKKKKPKVGPRTVTIIDDDIDLNNMRPIEAGEFEIFNTTEDAPQIVGVIDERGPVDFSDKKRWKIIADDGDGDIAITSNERNRRDVEHVTPLEESKKLEQRQKDDKVFPKKSKSHRDDDLSPARREGNRDEDLSPPRQRNFDRKLKSKDQYGSDSSPPRKNKDRRDDSDSDLSPPRSSKYGSDNRKPEGNRKSQKRKTDNRDSDLSVAREKKGDRLSVFKKYDSDSSPPRKSEKPPRNNKDRRNDSDSDLSPPRKSKKLLRKNRDRRNDSDSDFSPPRSSKYSDDNREVEGNRRSPQRKNNHWDNDLSPPRSRGDCPSTSKKYDSDSSPPRRSKKPHRKNRDRRNASDSDLSPPRSSKYDDDNRKQEGNRKAPQRKDSNRYSDLSPLRSKGDRLSASKKYDSDLSPPRKSKKPSRNSDSDLSPLRKSKKQSRNSEAPSRKSDKYNNDDFSPPRQSRKQSRNVELDLERSRKSRKTKNNYDSDLSPPRRNKAGNERSRSHSDNESVPSRSRKRSESPSKRTKHRNDDAERSKKKSRWNKESEMSQDIPEASDKRMKKTLDGKTAGLQDAKALRQETDAHKKREAELFQKLSAEVSGVGQATVIRDRKTGRKRDLIAEAAVQHEKDMKHQERVEKYAKWGKGLKQVEDQKEKLERDLYEMTKPLARYADDADLDKELRAQDRDGDPMLAYIKQKQLKEGTRKPDVPKYEGSFMPNRFGIRPGHRWDGVDRSNGYEKKWFEARNARKAVQEEAYKWSTSDM